MVTKKNAQRPSPKSNKATGAKKKAATKQAASLKKAPKKKLLKASAELAFYCNDGRLFYDLKELAEGLMAINEATFYHHVREGNNDFSNWVRDVIGDEKLSRDLLKSTTQAQAAKSIDDRVAWLKSKIEA